jgi:hypothetical protein
MNGLFGMLVTLFVAISILIPYPAIAAPNTHGALPHAQLTATVPNTANTILKLSPTENATYQLSPTDNGTQPIKIPNRWPRIRIRSE